MSLLKISNCIGEAIKIKSWAFKTKTDIDDYIKAKIDTEFVKYVDIISKNLDECTMKFDSTIESNHEVTLAMKKFKLPSIGF